ncbi:LysR substrate-binding domain-containing protein [Streptomyces sp. DSM 42041]|uniref:LysR substrate-binding domain-containing protein n=1 Tax=Streptomyces hazeniae TaxID=3075538 RepID=A0ABU2NVS3_9ACTN|nr:LysR substrate-binding domain-containing protein [Streptomyces sp. DSM 42041]MDT0381090.1 LysR substrate-binding domain-containing protein [Streptomyces sp. DSM 42041]
MEIRQLRYFVTVAEELHFGRAAARLHMSQPPLSQQIQRLERHLGFPLFERTRRSVHLTRAGEVLLQEAQRALAQADRAEEVAGLIRSGTAGTVRIGFVGSALYGVLPHALRSLRSRLPDVHFTAREMESNDQLRALEEDVIDLGLTRPPLPLGDLAVRDIHEEALVAALPEGHPLEGRGRPVALRELAAEPFVLFSPEHGSGFWATLARACDDAGFSPEVTYRAEHIHTMIGMVAAGLGVSLVPASAAQLRLGQVRYLPLAGPPVMLRLSLIWDGRRTLPALERVTAVLAEAARTYAATRDGAGEADGVPPPDEPRG